MVRERFAVLPPSMESAVQSTDDNSVWCCRGMGHKSKRNSPVMIAKCPLQIPRWSLIGCRVNKPMQFIEGIDNRGHVLVAKYSLWRRMTIWSRGIRAVSQTSVVSPSEPMFTVNRRGSSGSRTVGSHSVCGFHRTNYRHGTALINTRRLRTKTFYWSTSMMESSRCSSTTA